MPEEGTPAGVSRASRPERLGIVSYANVAPLHHGLRAWDDANGRVEFVYGVPSELNARLLAGDIDLTLISSIEFLRHRDRLVALPDFSIATLGPVHSVMLFSWRPLSELEGRRLAVTGESATSVELLRLLLASLGVGAELVRRPPDLAGMLDEFDGALLIGDKALVEAVQRRPIGGRVPVMTDLGQSWFELTGLPFTFAVWASPVARPPSRRLVDELRSARRRGLLDLDVVARREAEKRGLPVETMHLYLSNFRYCLEPADRAGLDEFGRRALGDGFDPGELRYWPDHST